MVFDVELLSNYYTKQSKVPKLRAFSIAFSITD